MLSTCKGCQQHSSVPEAASSGANFHCKGFPGLATNSHAHLVPALVMVQTRVGRWARERQRPPPPSMTMNMQLPLCLSHETSNPWQLQGHHGHTDALKMLQKQDFGSVSTRFLLRSKEEQILLHLPEWRERAVLCRRQVPERQFSNWVTVSILSKNPVLFQRSQPLYYSCIFPALVNGYHLVPA